MKSNQFAQGQERISKVLLCLFLFNTIFNNYLFAGGPTQPEATDFKPIGVSSNVNHFTGDFTYSIPIMDVEGFPIVLNYTGSVGAEEEASWVGSGWNINLGSVNRQMRGIPDEYNGEDQMTRVHSMMDNITGGVTLKGNVQFVNNQPLKRLVSLGFSLGLFCNNYTGWGYELGVSPTFSLSKTAQGPWTAGLDFKHNSESGLDLGGNISYGVQNKEESESILKSASFGLSTSINSREGIKELGFNSKLVSKEIKALKYSISHSPNFALLSFMSPSYTPNSSFPMTNEMYALAINLHGTKFIFDGGKGIMGNYSRQFLNGNTLVRGMYGYLNLEKANEDLNGLVDFNREKDISYHENVPAIAVPNMTYDVFTVNQPEMSNQFRAYRNNSKVLYDGSTSSNSFNGNLGLELGGGNLFQAGSTINITSGGTYTGKWILSNDFLSKGDCDETPNDDNPLKENYYFRAVDDHTPVNEEFENKVLGEQPVNVAVSGEGDGAFAAATLKDKSGEGHTINFNLSSIPSPNSIEKIGVRNQNFSFLTNSDRSLFGFDKKIISYGLNNNNYNTNFIETENQFRKDHHISEITLLNNDGRRAVYGIPAYNNYQNEVSFSTNNLPDDNGYVTIGDNENSILNRSGNDEYFNSEVTPGYAHSWLLTALLSPDYQDLTGNGISDDDLGNAYKLNYSRVSDNFKWKFPATSEANKAIFNEGLMADQGDNKASYIEGSREEWYTHSVESKNIIALFYLSKRSDAVSTHLGGLNPSTQKYKLDSIKLYSKKELALGYNQAKPIKVAHFRYDYSICQGVKNNTGGALGKLTLKEVFFTYGNNKRAAFNKYRFSYDNNPGYHPKNVDRWANYKDRSQNHASLKNDNYPYTLQDKNLTNQYAGAWLISKIELPSGGEVKVDYESDDYAYVQNRKAAYMQPLSGLSAKIDCADPSDPDCDYSSSKNYQDGLVKTLNQYLHFNLPQPVNTREEFANLYLKDPYNPSMMQKLYFRTRMRLHKNSLDEFVPGYADIEDYGIRNSGTVAWIKIKKIQYDAGIEGYHPFAYAGWQMLKQHMPTKAYPYNMPAKSLGPLGLIMYPLNLIGDLQELFLGYGSVAETFGFGQNCTPNETFIRLLKPNNIKLGGGARVFEITMTDKWQSMAGSNYSDASYGNRYTYTTESTDGKIISSGVAEYEPNIGGEENPMRQPIPYFGPHGLFAPASRLFIEEPICEGFFPSPKVGYSKVNVTSINSISQTKGVGSILYEFYTAKDYPVRTDRTNLSGDNIKTYKPDLISNFLKINDRKGIYLTQGYLVETNNMHGKPKQEINFNQIGDEIEKTIYHYHTKQLNTGERVLDNTVDVINEKNQISKLKMGVDYDFYTDMRFQSTALRQIDIELGGGAFSVAIAIIPHFLPFLPTGWMQTRFNSSSTMKHINKKAILTKVEKMKDGSWVTTENKLYDKNNGNAVVTSVTNEFNEKLFNVNLPAYWANKGMGFAYKNQGMTISRFDIDNANIVNSKLANILKPGDELGVLTYKLLNWIPILMPSRAWVIANPLTNSKYLADENGNLIQSYMGPMTILRSGNRNLLQDRVFSASMYQDPIQGGTLNLSAQKNILNASAMALREDWKLIDETKITTIKCVNPTAELNYIKTQSNILFNDKKTDIQNWLKP